MRLRLRHRHPCPVRAHRFASAPPCPGPPRALALVDRKMGCRPRQAGVACPRCPVRPATGLGRMNEVRFGWQLHRVAWQPLRRCGCGGGVVGVGAVPVSRATGAASLEFVCWLHRDIRHSLKAPCGYPQDQPPHSPAPLPPGYPFPRRSGGEKLTGCSPGDSVSDFAFSLPSLARPGATATSPV